MSQVLARIPLTLDHPGDEVITGSLHMPFAHDRNLATASVEAGTLAWLASYGLVVRGSPAETTLRAGRFHELAGLVYRVEDVEALQIVSDFISGLFFFDDLVDHGQSRLGLDPELAARASRLVAASMRTGKAPAPDATAEWPLVLGERQKLVAIAAALADLSRRLAARDPRALEPFFRAFEAYIESMACEASHRSGRAWASLADYAAVRTGYSAVFPCIELGLALRGVTVSPETRRDPDYLRAMEATNLSVSYVNDLYSYKRELLHEERTNLVMILERLRGASRGAAFAEACAIADGMVAQFLGARAAIEAKDPGARAATELFESWIRGNYDWHAGHTQRYVRALSTHVTPASA